MGSSFPTCPAHGPGPHSSPHHHEMQPCPADPQTKDPMAWGCQNPWLHLVVLVLSHCSHSGQTDGQPGGAAVHSHYSHSLFPPASLCTAASSKAVGIKWAPSLPRTPANRHHVLATSWWPPQLVSTLLPQQGLSRVAEGCPAGQGP